MKKKLITLLLTFVMTFTTAVPSFAAGSGNLDDLSYSLDTVKEAAESLEKSGEAVSSITSAINTAIGLAGKFNTVLSFVNGFQSILRMVGIMEDPTAKKLASISDQIKSLDEKMTAMAKDIKDLADSMSRLSADVGLGARANVATSMQKNWNDFNTNYVDKGIKPLVTKFEAYIRDGAKSWCNSVPSNAKIVVKYKKNSDGSMDAISGDEFDASVTIPKSCLPDSVSWDVDNYAYQIASAIKTSLSNNLDGATCTGGFNLTASNVGDVANDAANALLYDISVEAVNKNGSAFALEVRDAFSDYCKYLIAPDNGVNAMIKSMYQTHAFEVQIRDKINKLYDRIIVEAGAYGTFAMNVLGMSTSVTSKEKESIVKTLCNTVDTLSSNKVNALTGEDSYCYITNSLVKLTVMQFSSTVGANTDEYKDGAGWIERYEDVYADDIKKMMLINGEETTNMPDTIGDANAIMLLKTLEQNGVKDHGLTYFSTNNLTEPGKGWSFLLLAPANEICITSFKGQETLPIDNSVTMHCQKCIGTWYDTTKKMTVGSMPGDFSNSKFVQRKKIDGSTIALATGNLTSNRTLAAVATYGEGHWNWRKDEVYLFWGPVQDGFQQFTDVSKNEDGSRWRNYEYNVGSAWPVLISKPYIKGAGPGASKGSSLINFSGISSTKKYTAKALKKSSKTFSAKAYHDYGNALKYKLTANKKYQKKFAINSKTGKVTVKKGLKKGTYKIKVKAYTTNEVSSLRESKTKTIKIKVK